MANPTNPIARITAVISITFIIISIILNKLKAKISFQYFSTKLNKNKRSEILGVIFLI